MAFFYNLLQVVCLVLFSPVWIVLLIINERYRRGLAERLGISKGFNERLEKPSIWVHAASLGEVKVSAPICDELMKRFPSYEMVFSASTPVGKKQAKILIPGAKKIFLLPLDFLWAVCPVVSRCRPEFFLVAETELWPNLFFCLRRRGVRIALFNGRISDRSFERYKMFRFFFRKVLACVELFCVQTEVDVERFAALGVPRGRIHLTGNVKFDDPYLPLSHEDRDFLREKLDLTEHDTIWVAGSVHPEELPILLEAYQQVKKTHPELKWIVIPRHLYDVSFFEGLLDQQNDPYVTWKGNEKVSGPWDILLVNALGLLVRLYQLGFAAYVGGSLAPIGGHNPLEPLRYGVPVFFGPRMENFREIRDITVRESVAFTVSSAGEITSLLSRFLDTPELRSEIRKRCLEMFKTYQGATQRSIRQLEGWIRENSQR